MQQLNLLSLTLSCLLAGLTACGSSSSETTELNEALENTASSSSSDNTEQALNTDSTANNGETTDIFRYTASAGRNLAAQCFQCHGTDGYSQSDIDSLANESFNEIFEEMLELQVESDEGIMHFQALGYTQDEIRLIAEYFGR